MPRTNTRLIPILILASIAACTFTIVGLNKTADAAPAEQLGPCKRFINNARLPRWCPCKPLRYSIDPVGAPAGWTQDIHDAFQSASYYSKIPIRYTGKWPHGRQHQDNGDPVLVYYTRDTSGEGGYAEPYINDHTIKGGVIMLSPWLALSRSEHKRTVYHEVGHIFGLQHTNPISSFAVMGSGNPPYRAYDIYGFALFGRQNTDCP